MPKTSRVGSILAGLGLASGLALAQGTTGFEISFSNPGARSMGFGGAFIGLADDATAAYANPAGLVQLVAPEISVEARSWSHDTPFTAGGRASGPPTGLGIDTTSDLRAAVSSQESNGLSFLSYVHPLERWSLAVYRHQLADFESRFATEGLFRGASVGTTVRRDDARSSSRLDVWSYGVAAAYRISEDLGFGLGLSRVQGRITIAEETFRPDDDTREALFAPSSYLPARSIGTTEILSDDTDWTVLAGFLWRLSRTVSLGGVYRGGPELSADAIARAGPAFDPQVPPGSEIRLPASLRTPDVFGLGLAVRPRFWRDAVTLGFDWVRVEYSDLLEGFDPENFDPPRIDDGDELHAGVELVLLRTTPLVALRFGAWLDPDHRFRAGAGSDPFQRALLRGGDDEIHLAAGLGLAFWTFQLDFAVDLSELVDTASLSAIFRF